MAIKSRLFGGVWRSSLVDLAREEVYGLTHYFDEDTMRYFGARVLDCHSIFGGQLLFVRESVNHPSEGRFHRVVIFDLCGNVVFRGESISRNEKQAIKEWELWKVDNCHTREQAIALNLEALRAELRHELKHCDDIRARIENIENGKEF